MSDQPLVMMLPVGPVSVACRVWRYRGGFHVTAMAKATFGLSHGGPMRTLAPQPIHAAEVVGHGLVHAPCDVVPLLPRADVTFTGSAHAPRNGARNLRVRLALSRPRDPSGGSADGPLLLDKTLEITGNRTATTGWGGAPQAALFTTLPISYDRALGGEGHPLNPAGIGLASDARGRTLLPNIANPPHAAMAVEPAGFAPIPMQWPSRARLFPGLDRLLSKPIVELPDDVDLGHFHAAPFDQRIEFLRGDEWLILENLHAKYPRLETQLPGVLGVARVHTRSGEEHSLAMRPDALHIDGEAETATIVFRGSFPLPSFEALRMIAITAGMEQRGIATQWPVVGWPKSLIVESGAASPLRDVVIPSTENEPRRAPTLIIEDTHEAPPSTMLLSSTKVRAGTLVLEPVERFALEETVSHDFAGIVPLSAWQTDDGADDEDDGETHVLDATKKLG